MVIQVKVIGAKRISRMMLNLGPELNKMIDRTGGAFLKSVQKGAKIRAPKLTGALAESIHVRRGSKKGNWIFSVDSPYGRFVEMGFKPHLVSSSASTRAGSTIAAVYGIPMGVPLLVTATRGKNFVGDSFQAAIPKLPKLLSQATNRAIKNSTK